MRKQRRMKSSAFEFARLASLLLSSLSLFSLLLLFQSSLAYTTRLYLHPSHCSPPASPARSSPPPPHRLALPPRMATAPPPPPDPSRNPFLSSSCGASSSSSSSSSKSPRPALRRSKTLANPESPASWRRDPLHDVTNQVLGREREFGRLQVRLFFSSATETRKLGREVWVGNVSE